MKLLNPYETLLKIGQEINTVHDSSILLERVLDYAMETLSAERGFILLKKNNSAERQHEVVTARNINKESILAQKDYSSSVVSQVLESGEAVLSLDALSDDRFSGAQSVMMQQIKSVMCTPLRQNDDQLVGVIYMDSRAASNRFDQESLDFLKAFANQAQIAITNARLFEKLQSENKKLKRQISVSQLFPEIIGKSEAMIKIFELLRDVADSTASVLIEGESGTGKELVARALHFHSSRSAQAFIPIFCGSLSESLLESELFGHKKGSFTGASENKAGLFEAAHLGTIFLDEIADIGMNIQTKLLRVLQEGEIKRVGETIMRKLDVRVISATNKDLWKETKAGKFREDLYYRLDVINIKMPALRERREDITLLAEYFLKNYSLKNKKNIHDFNRQALDFLEQYHWPGNVRELENAVERAVILCRGNEIEPELFQLKKPDVQMPIGQTLDEINKFAIQRTIELVKGNRTKAAEMLGVSRRWLQYQLKAWGMADGN